MRALYEVPCGSGCWSSAYFPNKVEFIPHQSKGCLDEGCKTAEAQMADRVGYEWRAGDYHDVRLLHERLGIPLLRHYDLRVHE